MFKFWIVPHQSGVRMDWIATIAFIAGIITIIIGIALLFNLSMVIQIMDKIFGAFCIIFGVAAIVFGYKLIKSA
jgi:uncharacterized membrane protein HdeD (DUF308 family)